jgi:Fe-S-cluster containining protein
MFRECGECTACCSWLEGDAFGWKFGCGQSCKFLKEGKCNVYNVRPEVCRNYQCAWSQHLLPEEMRPDKCGYIVSVEFNDQIGQYLKVIPINNMILDNNIILWFENWSKKMNTLIFFAQPTQQ